MKKLQAPFTYFGGKSKAAELVWSRFGTVKNYVEPFCGSAVMLLARPDFRVNLIETVNDADGFIANFWRAIKADPDAVAKWADYPINEIDLHARHGWLVNRAERLKWSLEDPDFYDAKIAGWWVWGACAWIGGEWCASKGCWKSDGANIYKIAPTEGVKRILPRLGDAGTGINRSLPALGNAGKGIHKNISEYKTRTQFISEWFEALSDRLRNVRVACGDWMRVADSDCVTTRHGLTAIFLDPPYTKGNMQYAAGGVGGELADKVRLWCIENGANPLMRIAICGHAGEHNDLEALGWVAETWKAGSGMARSKEAIENRKSETIWFSPACLKPEKNQAELI